MAYMSEASYPNNIPEPEEVDAHDVAEIIGADYQIILEPASRLLYRKQDESLSFGQMAIPFAYQKRLFHF